MLSIKYKNYSTLSKQIGDYITIGLTSKSKGSNKRSAGVLKYYVAKEYKVYEQTRFENYVSDTVCDCIATRLFHLMEPEAPKTKIIDYVISASRIGSLDGRNDDSNIKIDLLRYSLHNNIKLLELNEIKRRAEERRIKGLLKSMVYRIIIGDWDIKTGNFSFGESKNNGNNGQTAYYIGPFDMTMLFDKRYKKDWTCEDLNRLFNDNNGDVVRNLSEVMGDVGDRVTDYYIKEPASKKNFQDIQTSEKVQAILKAELDYIVKEKSLNNHKDALEHVFNEVLEGIDMHFANACKAVKKEIEEKVHENEYFFDSINNGIYAIKALDTYNRYFDGIKKDVEARVANFKGRWRWYNELAGGVAHMPGELNGVSIENESKAPLQVL